MPSGSRRPGRDPLALKRFRLEMYGEPCEACELRPGTQIHHSVFRSRGGTDDPAGLRWLCHVCHAEAHGIRVVEDL